MPELPIRQPPVEVRIQLLDGFSVSIGERKIDASQFRLRKSRGLIKLLALAPNHRLHRDQLLEQLWPDQDPQTAAHNFYHTLYEARRILDPSGARASAQRYLQLHEETLSLCPDSPVLIDTEAFKTGANRAVRTQDPAAYQAALALYPGDLLPEDRYEGWSRDARETLRQEHLRLLTGLAQLLKNQNEYGAAIESLKQALVSDPLHEEAHAGLMRLFVKTGQRQLALRQYQFLEETLQRELEAQPDPLVTQLYQEILSGHYIPVETPPDPPGKVHVPAIPSHNLPVQMTSFIGRDQEKQAIKTLLLSRLEVKGHTQGKEIARLPPARLVTLTGAGGSGKTRLALETVGELLKNYPDGIWLVELAGLSDPELVPQTLIFTLHIQNASGQPLISILADYLKHKQLLLVLDNCEHLIEACARLVEKLLKYCPNLQILVTSQEILGLPGEVSYSITPLSVPDPLPLLPIEITNQSEAVRLFVERAGNARPDFTLNENNAPAIVQICRRLDGIPLAIELAAARVKLMQVEEIAARLEQSFDLLTGGSRTALPRFQSLRASIDWSYHLLSEAERILFRRLAVFAGGWSVDAASFIASGSGDVMDLLTQLVNKSLITPHQIPGAPTRYFYLDTIRRFALARLSEVGDEQLMRDRHLDYFQQLASRLGALWYGPDQVALMSSLEAENDNLRAALEWSLANQPSALLPLENQPAVISRSSIEKGLVLAVALVRFWNNLFNRAEGTFWLERLLVAEVQQRGPASLGPARALARAWALYTIGWYKVGDQSLKYMDESLLIFRELGLQGRQGAAYVLRFLALDANWRGDYPLCQVLAGESLVLFRAVGDSYGLAELLSGLFTLLAWNQGNPGQARKYIEEALAIFQDLGNQDGIAWAYLFKGMITAREGNYPQAWTLMENAQDIYLRLSNKIGNYFVLEQMGKAARAQGDSQHAEALFSEALALTRQVGDRWPMTATLINLARSAYDQGEYEHASKWYSEAILIAREIEERPAISRSLRGLAEISRARLGAGNIVPALRLYQQALQARGNPPDLREIYRALEGLARLAVDLEEPETAVQLFAATQELYDSIRFSFWPPHPYNRAEMVSSLKSHLGEAAFGQVWSQGQALTLEQAIQLALSLESS
jgi:predicted ATPase/DNA-binding SARP family transcriptional activator